MPRIVGVDIPDRKQCRYALRYIHGVGPKVADEILAKCGIDPTTKAFELSENQVAQLSSLIDAEYVIEGALRRQTQQNISRLREIRSYRGARAAAWSQHRCQRRSTRA